MSTHIFKQSFLLVLSLFLYTPYYLNAQCIATNANTGVTYTSEDNNGSSYTWSNPSGANGEDGTFSAASATVAVLSGNSDYLKVSGFGFNIPVGSTICGITVTVVKRAVGLGLGNNVRDDKVQLVVDNTIRGTNKANNSNWGSTAVTATHGSASDVWGLSLTPADINDPNFGVAISTRMVGLATLLPTAQIDHISMNVHYDAGAALPLKLAHFNSTLTGNIVSHQWILSEQENGATITVQRKKSEGEWKNIHSATVTKQGYNINYGYDDQLDEQSTYYYRLQFRTLDGTESFSRINRIEFTNPLKPAYPNPAMNYILIEGSGDKETIKLYNQWGVEVKKYRLSFSENSLKVHLDYLPKGIYFLHRRNSVQLFLKQ